MKLITLKKENDLIIIKLNKKSYKGKTFVILPREGGYFSSKRVEEENYFVLYYNTNGKEIEVFNFSNMGELNKVISEIEQALLHEKKSWINKYIKGAIATLLTLLILSLPIIVFQIWKDYQINNEMLRVKLDMIRQMNTKGNIDTNNLESQQRFYEMVKKYDDEKKKNNVPQMNNVQTPDPDNRKEDQNIANPNVKSNGENKSLPVSENNNTKIEESVPSIQEQLNTLKENRNK